ncbi:MAG: SurA N-terminal domain-containing protein [Pseudomonadota bacterium]
MAESVGKKASNIGVWVIMGLLIVGLMGFGAGSFGGGGQTIGQVGDKRISAQTYFTALTNQIRNFQAQTGQALSFPQAEQIGLQQQVLSQLVTQRALDNEVANLGISVGDEAVRDEILRSGAFTGLNGEFDRVLYSDLLSRQGLTEETYETQIREDLSRQLLQLAVVGGVKTPQTFSDTLISFAGEQRAFSWALMGPADLITPLPEPTPEQLQSEYDANPDAYTLPEMKEITYVWLTPDMILDTVEVDEQALQELYEARKAEFVQPERRLVERLVFGNAEQATEARARIDAGGTFEAEVEARGLQLSDIDLGDVLPSDLGPAADTVFGGDALAVVGPVNTPLGPALFRINAILPAQETTLEDARDVLQDELALDRAARVISDQIDFLENELAGGATIEDLAATSDMELGSLQWFPGAEEDAAAYAAFQDAADAVADGDFPEIAILDDGGIFALRLDGTIDPRLQPLEDVTEDVTAAWELTATSGALANLAERLSPQIAAGTDMATLGLTAAIEEGIVRGSFIPGAPLGFVDQVFEMEPGDVRVIPGEGTVALVRLDGVSEADREDPDTARLVAAISQQIGESYAQDLYAAYASGILDQTSINLDQGQINGIHAQIQ